MMYKKDQNYLWQNLTDVQRERITILKKNLVYKFGNENPMESCGGATVGDYYRISIEYLTLNILEALEEGK